MSHFHDCSPRPSSHQAHNEDPEILLGVIYLPYCPVLPHSPYLCCTACLSSNFFLHSIVEKKIARIFFFRREIPHFFAKLTHIFSHEISRRFRFLLQNSFSRKNGKCRETIWDIRKKVFAGISINIYFRMYN